MIIKKKAKSTAENSSGAQNAPKKREKNIKPNKIKKKALEKKEKKQREEKGDTADKNEPVEEKPKKTPLEEKLEEYEKIDVSVLEFKERYERRRGDRRRGFRRIDERALVSRAQEEAQSIREIAAKEGYKNGLNEAKNEIEILKASLKDFVSAKNVIYEEVSSHILEIALEVAKKIIKKETELSGDVLKGIILDVLGELSGGEEKITIKVNPEDGDFAKASLPEIIEESQTEAKIIIQGDELVEKGSCTVIANNGVVDANFTTQLSIIQNAFGIYQGGE